MHGNSSASPSSHPSAVGPAPDELRFGRLVGAVDRHWRRRIDLTLKQFDVTYATRMPLVVLADHGGPMRQNALAAALAVDSTSLFRPLNQLVAKGLVSCAPDPDDGRAKLFALTPAGDAIVQEILAESRKVEAAFLSEFAPEDIATTRRVLERLGRRLEEGLPPCADAV